MTQLLHARHWIGGEWIDADKPAESVNPATGEPIGTYTEAGPCEAAIAAGARVVVRGGPFTDGPLARGAFYRPALLEIDDYRLPIAQEEVFGPVLIMQAFDTESEAVSLANDSQYGLAASIWSTDVDRPLRVTRRIDAGTVWIKGWAIVHDETEEGGFKQSGLGRLNGLSRPGRLHGIPDVHP